MKQKRKRKKERKKIGTKLIKLFFKWQFGQFLSLPNAFWEN
jgi:hypothetical protein